MALSNKELSALLWSQQQVRGQLMYHQMQAQIGAQQAQLGAQGLNSGMLVSRFPAQGAWYPPQPLVAAGMKVEDLIGWRIWRVKDGHLWSYSVDYAWLPDGVAEGVPGDHDSLGIWAFKDKRRAFQKALESATPNTAYVWGSVRLWGRVVEHADGYRASKARIMSIDGASQDLPREALASLCATYGVSAPVRSRSHLLAPEPSERRAEPRALAFEPPPRTPFELFIALACFFLLTVVALAQ